MFPLARVVVLGCALFACALVEAAGARAVGPTVYVNEMAVATLRTSYKSAKPEARASLFAKRVAALPSGAVISIKGGREGHQLFAGSVQLLVITAAEATAQKSSPAGLARTWAGQLSEALSLPALRPKHSVPTVRCTENRTLRDTEQAPRNCTVA